MDWLLTIDKLPLKQVVTIVIVKVVVLDGLVPTVYHYSFGGRELRNCRIVSEFGLMILLKYLFIESVFFFFLGLVELKVDKSIIVFKIKNKK